MKSSRNISALLSITVISGDLNLVRTFSGNNFFDPNYGVHP